MTLRQAIARRKRNREHMKTASPDTLDIRTRLDRIYTEYIAVLRKA